MDHVEIIRCESVSDKEKSLNWKAKPVYQRSFEANPDCQDEKLTPESVSPHRSAHQSGGSYGRHGGRSGDRDQFPEDAE